MFKVSVSEISAPTTESPVSEVPQMYHWQVVRYEQTVDALDMNALIAAVNRKPRKPRVPKAKAGNGTD